MELIKPIEDAASVQTPIPKLEVNLYMISSVFGQAKTMGYNYKQYNLQ